MGIEAYGYDGTFPENAGSDPGDGQPVFAIAESRAHRNSRGQAIGHNYLIDGVQAVSPMAVDEGAADICRRALYMAWMRFLELNWLALGVWWNSGTATTPIAEIVSLPVESPGVTDSPIVLVDTATCIGRQRLDKITLTPRISVWDFAEEIENVWYYGGYGEAQLLDSEFLGVDGGGKIRVRLYLSKSLKFDRLNSAWLGWEPQPVMPAIWCYGETFPRPAICKHAIYSNTNCVVSWADAFPTSWAAKGIARPWFCELLDTPKSAGAQPNLDGFVAACNQGREACPYYEAAGAALDPSIGHANALFLSGGKYFQINQPYGAQPVNTPRMENLDGYAMLIGMPVGWHGHNNIETKFLYIGEGLFKFRTGLVVDGFEVFRTWLEMQQAAQACGNVSRDGIGLLNVCGLVSKGGSEGGESLLSRMMVLSESVTPRADLEFLIGLRSVAARVAGSLSAPGSEWVRTQRPMARMYFSPLFEVGTEQTYAEDVYFNLSAENVATFRVPDFCGRTDTVEDPGHKGTGPAVTGFGVSGDFLAMEFEIGPISLSFGDANGERPYECYCGGNVVAPPNCYAIYDCMSGHDMGGGQHKIYPGDCVYLRSEDILPSGAAVADVGLIVVKAQAMAGETSSLSPGPPAWCDKVPEWTRANWAKRDRVVCALVGTNAEEVKVWLAGQTEIWVDDVRTDAVAPPLKNWKGEDNGYAPVLVLVKPDGEEETLTGAAFEPSRGEFVVNVGACGEGKHRLRAEMMVMDHRECYPCSEERALLQMAENVAEGFVTIGNCPSGGTLKAVMNFADGSGEIQGHEIVPLTTSPNDPSPGAAEAWTQGPFDQPRDYWIGYMPNPRKAAASAIYYWITSTDAPYLGVVSCDFDMYSYYADLLSKFILPVVIVALPERWRSAQVRKAMVDIEIGSVTVAISENRRCYIDEAGLAQEESLGDKPTVETSTRIGLIKKYPHATIAGATVIDLISSVAVEGMTEIDNGDGTFTYRKTEDVTTQVKYVLDHLTEITDTVQFGFILLGPGAEILTGDRFDIVYSFANRFDGEIVNEGSGPAPGSEVNMCVLGYNLGTFSMNNLRVQRATFEAVEAECKPGLNSSGLDRAYDLTVIEG